MTGIELEVFTSAITEVRDSQLNTDWKDELPPGYETNVRKDIMTRDNFGGFFLEGFDLIIPEIHYEGGNNGCMDLPGSLRSSNSARGDML